jgi:hypothetical protein
MIMDAGDSELAWIAAITAAYSEVYLRRLDAARGASAAGDACCIPYCCGWSRGLSATLGAGLSGCGALARPNSVNAASRPSSARSRRRPSIWLTFHPPISSPICTRSIFALPERTMARARSRSTTTPSRVTSGGGAGGGGAAATGAGGGAGGRRSGENSGRSRVADSLASGCACRGLPGVPAEGSFDCAFASVTKIASHSTRTQIPGNDDERAIPCAQRPASADGTQERTLCLLDAARGSCSVPLWASWLMNSLCCMRRYRSIRFDDASDRTFASWQQSESRAGADYLSRIPSC